MKDTKLPSKVLYLATGSNLGIAARDAAGADGQGPALIDRVADTTSHRDRDALDHSVARLLQEFLDARSITLYRLIEDKAVTRVARRAAVIRGQAEILIDDVFEPARLPAVTADPAWQECLSRREIMQYVQAGSPARYLFPIEDERDVIGMLEVIADIPMQPRDATLVHGILRVLKNQLALLDYGERDTLTGLLNRKTFESRFQKLGQGPRTSRDTAGAVALPSWLGLLDIDHFKSINDRYGHLFGDEVLLLVSQIMKRTLRGSDQLFRFGGEEFLIVLERVDDTGAGIAFERLRVAVETYAFPQAGRVTISLGYTNIAPRDVPTTCVERADGALYFAKRAGRNNVRRYEALIAAGDLTAKEEEGSDVELF
jgi:diguanylate cyclase (GGDEF)-like protein